MISFAEQIAKFPSQTMADIDAVVAESVREAGQRLIDRSPIDTGRFKSNWNFSLETPDIHTTEATDIRTVNGIEDLPKRAASFISYITNSLPYGPSLERGTSKQAPNGMVRLTSLEWGGIVAAAAQKVAGK